MNATFFLSRRISFLVFAIFAFGLGLDRAKGCEEPRQPEQSINPSQPSDSASADYLAQLTARALDQNYPTRCLAALKELRREGKHAVDYLLSRPELRQHPNWEYVLDQVAGQKDAQYSGLFWYTNLDEALAAAQKENKPILSLRLLGNLTEELSCANSRFFRTTLYPNAAVRQLLSEKYILHWQSVRSAPVMTIDFGDGRMIRRTITGNSLHLVLDRRGRTVDVVPGVFAAGRFVEILKSAGTVAVEMGDLDDGAMSARNMKYHDAVFQSLKTNWSDLLQRAGFAATLEPKPELPDEIWFKLEAASAMENVVLDESASRAVLAHRAPPAKAAGRRALSKAVVEDPALALIRNISANIRQETLRNDYTLYRQLHEWFQTPQLDSERLVQRIYSELFLSPLDDPWYGLSRPDRYSALKDDGRLPTVSQNTGR